MTDGDPEAPSGEVTLQGHTLVSRGTQKSVWFNHGVGSQELSLGSQAEEGEILLPLLLPLRPLRVLICKRGSVANGSEDAVTWQELVLAPCLLPHVCL